MSAQPPIVSHPIRMALMLFAAMASLFVACAPFVPDVNTLPFVAAGLGYCLLLALFSVGIGLAFPSRTVDWWLWSGLIPFLSTTAFLLLIQSDPEIVWRVLPGVTRGLLVLLLGWLVVGSAVASWGWAKYFRCYR